VTGHVAFDANRKMNLIYVYCDVAADCSVGDARAPLMRVCNVSGERGRAVHVVYVRPHYVPVGRREFDTVKISINNEAGSPMPFEFGKSVVVLQFRRQGRNLTVATTVAICTNDTTTGNRKERVSFPFTWAGTCKRGTV
jgi:hypothetical protein